MRPGLLIIDMQERYVKDLNPQEVPRLLVAQQRTIDYFLRKNYLIGLIESDVVGRGETIPAIRNMLPREEEIYFFKTEKRFANLFMTNDKIHLMRTKLEATNTTHLAVMGIYAGSCVLETIHGAARNDIAIMHTALDILGDNPMHAVPDCAEEIQRYALVHRNHESLINSMAQLASNKKN